MSCSSFDLKAYFLGELDQKGTAAAEAHAGACQDCRDELDRLRIMQSAILSLPHEEIPQRIAFVSDKVFEPRWWQTIWQSGPAMGFASAALLSAAILVHASIHPTTPTPNPDTARIERQVNQEVAQRVNTLVAQAIAQSEARQASQVSRMLAASEKRLEQQRKQDFTAIQQVASFYDQQLNKFMVASNDAMADRPRGGQ